MPLLTDTVRISPYVNRVDGGNTIFAYSEDRLVSITQATNTEEKLWRTHRIQMEPVPKPEPEPSKSFESYTTTIALLDANDKPLVNESLSLRADSHASAFVNGEYHVLGWSETIVKTDQAGLVTVVEASEDAYATILYACSPQDNETTIINPMDKPFSRVEDLDNADGIRNATYPAKVVAGGVIDEAEEYLVDPEAEQKDIDNAAKSMKHFKEIYEEVKPPPKTSKLIYRTQAPRVARRGRGEKGPNNVWSLWSAIGDVFRWLKKAAKKAIEVVKDTAKGV